MSEALRAARRLAWIAAPSILVAACNGPRELRTTPMHALAGFREASPLVAELTRGAAAVAVFAGVEGTAEGCAHVGVLVLPDGGQDDVVLRCIEEPRAPSGYSYHQLVVLRDPGQVERLRSGSLEIDDFAHLAPHDDHPLTGHEDAPGWIVSTRRSQLLFGDQTVRQRLEPARSPRRGDAARRR